MEFVVASFLGHHLIRDILYLGKVYAIVYSLSKLYTESIPKVRYLPNGIPARLINYPHCRIACPPDLSVALITESHTL